LLCRERLRTSGKTNPEEHARKKVVIRNNQEAKSSGSSLQTCLASKSSTVIGTSNERKVAKNSVEGL